MEVEEVFHVDLADEEWLALRTLGDVHSSLRLHIPHFSGGTCASMVAFHRLRRALIACRVPRSEFVPEASLSSLLSPVQWRQGWAGLERDVGLRLPRLELSRSSAALIGLSAVGGGVSTGWAFGPTLGVIAGLTGAVAAAIPLRLVPVPTVRALVQSVVELNYGALLWAGASWRDAEAFRVLAGIAAVQFGVPFDGLRPGTLLLDLAPDG